MTESQSHKAAGGPWISLAIVCAFVLANVVIMLLAEPGCYSFDGACSNQHDRYGYPVARGLLAHGAIVEPDDPTQPYTRWPPGYGVVIAATIWLGAGSFVPLIWLQLAAVLACGLVVRQILAPASPVAGTVGMALLVFNPNVLGGAHLVQAESFQLLLLSCALWAAFGYCRRPTLASAAAVGAFLALATLMRPVTQFLVPLLPLAFAIAAALAGRSARRLLPGFGAGLLATACALAIIAPWLVHQVRAGEGLRMGGRSAELLFIYDNLRFLTEEMPGEGNQPWKRAFIDAQEQRLAAQVPGWQQLTPRQQVRERHEDARRYLATLPFDGATLAVAMTKSALRFFVSGGEGEIHSLFAMEYQPEKNPLAFYGIKAGAIGYAALLRLLGLMGIVYLLATRRYAELFLLLSVVAYFFLAHFVHGKPRFRIPVEVPLCVLAAYGTMLLPRRLWHRGADQGSDAVSPSSGGAAP